LRRGTDNYVFATGTSAFQAYSDGSLSDYIISLTEEGEDFNYRATVSDIPAISPSDAYYLEIWEQAGASAVRSDDYLISYHQGSFQWDGARWLYADQLLDQVNAIKTKTDTIPAVLSITQPNLDQSSYEVAQYSTATMTFTVRDSATHAIVDLTGKTLYLDVRADWAGKQLFSKSGNDFDLSAASDGQASVSLVASDTEWTGRIQRDTEFEAEMFESTSGNDELGRFILVLRPSHLSAP